MKFLKSFLAPAILTGAISVIPLAAQALVISDVIEFNAPMVNGQYTGLQFNLVNHGYNHHTDSITSLKLSFDIREIVETEEDMENWEDMTNWEFIIFYSWIFDGRSIFADIDTGITSFAISWNKTYSCQYSDYVNDEETCLQNVDLFGEVSSWFVAYTDNLWLNEARLDAEVTRIPEPAPVLLFGLGLLGIAARCRYSSKYNS